MNKNIFSEQTWFKEEFEHKLGQRYITQKIALTLVNQLFTNPLIVETGTIRLENDWGAGMSTYVFGKYVRNHGGKIITIDLSSKNMEVCKRVTKEYNDTIEYIVDDSLHYLSTIAEKINFLYLDSMDCPVEGDATIPQLHNLNEFLICENKLSDKAVIMIDDVGFSNGGKAAKTHEYLYDNKYLLIYKNQQSVWLK